MTINNIICTMSFIENTSYSRDWLYITSGLVKWVSSKLYNPIPKSTVEYPVPAAMQTARINDNTTHIYNPWLLPSLIEHVCEYECSKLSKLPNVSTGRGEMKGQRFKPDINLSWKKIQTTDNFLPPAGLKLATRPMP